MSFISLNVIGLNNKFLQFVSFVDNSIIKRFILFSIVYSSLFVSLVPIHPLNLLFLYKVINTPKFDLKIGVFIGLFIILDILLLYLLIVLK